VTNTSAVHDVRTDPPLELLNPQPIRYNAVNGKFTNPVSSKVEFSNTKLGTVM
jgi:hypothetical protein